MSTYIQVDKCVLISIIILFVQQGFRHTHRERERERERDASMCTLTDARVACYIKFLLMNVASRDSEG